MGHHRGGFLRRVYPPQSNGTRRREAKSISFANMKEAEFFQVYKAVFNVLWNTILFKKFRNYQEADNVAMQLLEFAA